MQRVKRAVGAAVVAAALTTAVSAVPASADEGICLFVQDPVGGGPCVAYPDVDWLFDFLGNLPIFPLFP